MAPAPGSLSGRQGTKAPAVTGQGPVEVKARRGYFDGSAVDFT